ncbi:MAG: Do family serine endopeptidase [Bryobacteraceae bacterium]|jgi:Do/DeqQ family serine protease
MKRILLILALALVTFACRSRSGGSEPRSMPSGSVALKGPLLSYADVVDRVAPAVVTIRSSQRVRAPRQFPFSADPFFRQFFGGGIPQGDGGTQVEESLGSGVIVRPDGHILTNHHVIDGADKITVDLSSGHKYSATVVGSDAPSDLAVLKISAGGLPVLQLGDSDQVRVGDVCLAVGNPLGVGETVTAGIISAKGRVTGLGSGSFEDFLQTDAPINKGNSGGALVNTRGELIGINSQILTTNGSNGGSIGIGFAIPSNMAKTVMNQLIGKGKVQRGMLGVGIENVTGSVAQSLGMKDARGIVITYVYSGQAADRAGLKRYDVILQLNGKDENDTNAFRNRIAAMAPGTEVTLTIWRSGAQQRIRATLGELTPESALAQGQAGQGGGRDGGSGGRLGVTVEPLTPNLAAQMGRRRSAQGLVVTEIDPSGPAAEAGVRTGDIILEVNRQAVRSVDDVRKALERPGRQALLLIDRDGQTAVIAVPLQ